MNVVEEGYEIDFLPVGEGEKSGDAIAMRITKNGKTKIYVIDGGTQASGKALVEHIQKYYGTDQVDYLISTHPDADHISGLKVVLEKLKVKELWMHKPWEHAPQIFKYIKDGRVTPYSLSKRIESVVKLAVEVEKIATEKGVEICEPFQGVKIGSYFTVLSPGESWYNELLKEFDGMPPSRSSSANESLKFSNRSDVVYENWDRDTLDEKGETSARNESSVVLLCILPDDKRVLFTGDAGIRALTKAYYYASVRGYDLKKCSFIQMPHHGSRRNVSPPLLDKLLGPILKEGYQTTKTCFVSASGGSPKHPSLSVVNAFIRRGVKVVATMGKAICYHSGDIRRDGWGPVSSLPFSSRIEK